MPPQRVGGTEEDSANIRVIAATNRDLPKLVGEGKWLPADFRAALDARDRSRCGAMAPAAGLYLTRVDY